MNRGAIRTRTRIFLDEPLENRWYDVALNSLIEEAKNKVAALFLCLDETNYIKDDHFDLTATTELYPLPADFIRLKEIHDEDDEVPNKIPVTKRSEYINRGEVVAFYFQKNQIGFLSVPTQAEIITYKYVYAPAELSDDNSIPDTPTYLGHDLIAVYAAIQALDLDEDEDVPLIRKAQSLEDLIRNVYYKRTTHLPEYGDPDSELDPIDE